MRYADRCAILKARIIALLLLLTLSACSPGLYPMEPGTETARIAGSYLIVSDGTALPLQIWTPEGEAPPRAAIVGLHGFNDYRNAFALPATWWAENNIATYAFDQRGFGGAPHRRFWAGTKTMASDFRDAVRAVKAKHPGLPVFGVGVSMGGAVVMAALAEGKIDGLAGAGLVAPAVWGRKHMNVLQRASLWLVYNTLPGMIVTAEGLNIQPSDNIPMLRRLAGDPNIIRETRVGTIKGLVDLMDTAYGTAAKITHTPVLMVYGQKDEIVPKPATFEVMRALKRVSSRARFALYDKGWHMLLRDLQAKTLWRDIKAWIGDPNAKLPSGAEKRAAARLATP